MIPLYIHRESLIHRLSAGAKLLISLAASTVIFFIEPLWLLAAAACGIAGLYRAACLPLETLVLALRPVLMVGALIFVLQLVLAGLAEAAGTLLRIYSAILLVSLVTLTTRFSDMLNVLTRLARPRSALSASTLRGLPWRLASPSGSFPHSFTICRKSAKRSLRGAPAASALSEPARSSSKFCA